MFFVIAPVVLGLLIVATVSDVRSREVPDWISVVIGLVALVSAALDWLGIGLEWVLAGGAIGLVIGYSLFVFASFGGGDAKLIAALGMIVGPVGLLIVLFGMAIAGGVLSLSRSSAVSEITPMCPPSRPVSWRTWLWSLAF